MTGRVIESYLARGLRFSSVGDLGVSLSVLRHSLRICEGAQRSEVPLGEYIGLLDTCLLYTSPSPRDLSTSRMPSSA